MLRDQFKQYLTAQLLCSMGSVSVQHKMDETELPWRIKPSDEKRPPADASPEQFPVLREVRFRPNQS